MYEQFYGIDSLPFVARPAAGEYYFNEQQRRILEDLDDRIGQGNGVFILGGSDGVGKTTLVRSLCANVQDRVEVFNVDAAKTPGEVSLAQRIVAALGTKVDGDEAASADAGLASVADRLSSPERHALLVIDNAEELSPADSEVLEKLVTGPGLQILLVTNPADRPGESGDMPFPALTAHIEQHYTLLPLSPIETDTYIRLRLIQAGASAELFTPPACEAVYRYSKGLPRLINRICDLALVYGYSRQSEQIDRQVMDFVLNDRWGGHQQAAARQSPLAGTDTGHTQTADARMPLPATGSLRAGEQDEANIDPRNERDIYDFIRLSMKYHQRHLERFTYAVVAGVVIVTVAATWGFIAWQNSNRPAAEIVSGLPAHSAPSRGTVIPDAGAATGAVPISGAAAVPARAGAETVTVSAEKIRKTEQAALEVPAPAGEAAKQAGLIAEIEAKNRALQAERRKLEQERRRLKQKLAAQRAENERLEREREIEQERAREARSQVMEARRNARMTWDRINASTPDPFPED